MRRYYRYDVRQFKIEDGGYHQCTGQVVAVLGSTYSRERSTWYVTVLCRKDQDNPDQTPGEEVFTLGREEEACCEEGRTDC